MDKTKLKNLIDSFKRKLGMKDEIISDLEFKLKHKDAAAIIKMPEVVIPDTYKISNLPEVQKVHIENSPEIQKVELTNPVPVQKVEVTNAKDVQFPETQKVEVTNAEKSSSWVPDVIKHAAVAIVAGLAKRLDMGITVRTDPEDKLSPQAVIMVDTKGRPINMQPQVAMFPAAIGTPAKAQPSAFGIGNYDDIKLSGYDASGNPGAVAYYYRGVLIASLTLTYDGSSNLTDAKRTA